MSKTALVSELTKSEVQEVPLGDSLRAYAIHFQESFRLTLDLAAALEQRIGESTITATDRELALHELFLRELKPLFTELARKLGEVQELNWRRVTLVLLSRESDGFVGFGKKFTADADLLPTIPGNASPEYGELLAWLKSSEFSGVVKEQFSWQSLQKICDLLAERGAPPPPHVRLSPKFKVKVT